MHYYRTRAQDGWRAFLEFLERAVPLAPPAHLPLHKPSVNFMLEKTNEKLEPYRLL